MASRPRSRACSTRKLAPPASCATTKRGPRTADAPGEEEHVTYTYDPADPVPMRGGAGSLAFILADGGPVHSVLQEGLCERGDILSFTGEPLREPLRIAGPILVGLSVSSTARYRQLHYT